MTLDFPHDVPHEAPCPGEGVEIDMTMAPYVKASWSEAAYGGPELNSDLPESCPCCGHQYTDAELKRLESTAFYEAARDAEERNDRSNYL